ncbi:calcium uniporter protein 4, mitochondrial-like [Juglans regia]|uniref:Calcium uniporter protein 4, mitochondrial-like n=1 Tax=Juglans regia TaxID=51240 RepID=A0A2I4EDL9_JUGRE|nr:calcium uniporter protein 4, mitochondrial-like [Juglans regia]
MAYRKTLAKRLFDGCRVTSPSVTLEHTPISSPSGRILVIPPNASKTNFHREYITSPDSAEKGFFRRFLHRRTASNQSSSRLPEFLSLPVGHKLRETLRAINITGDGLRLDGLRPPAANPAVSADSRYGISVHDARKILRLTQMEKLKAKLGEIPKSSISYSEFVRICIEGCDQNEDQGLEFAKTLDDSGNVIVLGSVVFLRPDQVAKSMETLISQTIANPNDPRRKELEEMEARKTMIDSKARSSVMGELCCGLGFLLAQALAFMRLTFWELTWDVMEPICFFTASLDFALCYAFFLRTSIEPSFRGYYQCRFIAKQRKLMALHNFDFVRYNELRKACYSSSCSSIPNAQSFSPLGHGAEGFVGAMRR